MGNNGTPERIKDFLGSIYVFASALTNVMEEELLSEVTGGQLTYSQLRLIKLVGATDGATVGDVAAFLGVSNAAASKAVDKLVRRMLLRRVEAEADRRTSQISLTSPGKQLLDGYEEAKERRLNDIFSGFSPEELEHAAALLDRLAARVVNSGAMPGEVCLKCNLYFREKCTLRQFGRVTCVYQHHRIRRLGEPVAGANGGKGAGADR